jgi:hypothetical protein
VPYRELIKEVGVNSAHSKSLAKLCGILRVNDLNNIKTMRELAIFVNSTDTNETNRNEIIQAAMTLSFPNKYWSTSVINVKKALELINDPDATIPVDMPLHPTALFSSDRLELIMYAFGHQAFTFMIPNSTKIQLSANEPPKNLHIRTITTQTAVQDMKYVMENGFITNNPTNLSSRHRDTPVKGREKGEMWKLLGRVCKSETVNVATKPSSPKGNSGGGSIEDDLW